MNKKIAMLIAAFLLVAIASVSVSLAYFRDTDYIRNEFTVGNVEIDLTEGKPAEERVNGNIVAAEPAERMFVGETAPSVSYHYGKLFPGMTIYKDPAVKNTGSEDAYVCAKITIDDGSKNLMNIESLFPHEPYIAVFDLVSGGFCAPGMTLINHAVLGANTHESNDVFVKQVYDENETKWVIYMFVKDVLTPGEEVTFFNQLTVPSNWDHKEMQEFKEFSITVEAFATQANGFFDCVQAITTSFDWTF